MQADWHNLGEVLYRKWHVYDMGWQNEAMQIENFQVCGAQFGGPIAMIRDNRKSSTSEDGKAKLRIFTSSGLKIAEVDWDSSRKVIGMGWSDLEQLVMVLDDGENLENLPHHNIVEADNSCSFRECNMLRYSRKAC